MQIRSCDVIVHVTALDQTEPGEAKEDGSLHRAVTNSIIAKESRDYSRSIRTVDTIDL